MERSFVLVFILVTLATATPHGYGVKGGASAKAEARAVAGSFGDLGPIPLSIPSGAAYSGSFSKSSSSSFASSSASASSSSYSFSGSGGNGIAGIGAGKGCSSGTCPGIGATGPSSNGAPHYGGANAVAAAQAKAESGSYTPCHGSNCSPDEKCSSGQCSTESEQNKNGCSDGSCQSDTSKESGNGQTTECVSGQCDKYKQDVDNDSNDFAVNINRNSKSKSSHDLSGQYSNKDTPNCGNEKCSSSNSDHSHVTNNHNQQLAPATYLTTPNENPPCTTSDCNYPSQAKGPETGKLPSSYNVPLQSATNPPHTDYFPSGNSFESGSQTYQKVENKNKPGAPCTTPGCVPFNTGPSNIHEYGFEQQTPSIQGSCTSGRCDNGPGTVLKSPNYSHDSSFSSLPSGQSVQSGCRTPDCAEFSGHVNVGSSTRPTYTISSYPNFPEKQPHRSCDGIGCSGTTQTGLPENPTKSDAPMYSGGFGGPARFLDTISGDKKETVDSANHYGATYTPATSGSAGAPGSALPHGSHGKNKEYESPANHYVPTHTTVSNGNGAYASAPTHGSFVTTKTNQFNPNNHYNPSTSGPVGAFGSPLNPASFGTSKPNDFNSNGLAQASGNGGLVGISGYNKPNDVPSTQATQNNPSGNYGAPTQSTFVPLGSVAHPENNGIYKPTPIGHTVSSPAYTGGFGSSSNANSGHDAIHGSFGISKPSTISNAPRSPTYTGGFSGPTETGIADGTSSTYGSGVTNGAGNCESNGCNGQSSISGDSGATSNSDAANSSQKKPVYNGGFGGPTGFLKPNDLSIPSNSPTLQAGNNQCLNGNCLSKDKSPASYGHGSSLSGTQSLASATASANAVAYSGGFGGPPGVLKPFDDGKGNSPIHSNIGSDHAPPNTANPGALSSHGKISTPGSSANGANPVAHASASALATAGSYNGGKNNNAGAGGCNSGCDSNGDGVNNGFPDGLVKNGLGAGSAASAKSISGANAFGFGGSYASSSASAHASAGTKGGYGRK